MCGFLKMPTEFLSPQSLFIHHFNSKALLLSYIKISLTSNPAILGTFLISLWPLLVTESRLSLILGSQAKSRLVVDKTGGNTYSTNLSLDLQAFGFPDIPCFQGGRWYHSDSRLRGYG